MVSLAPVYGSGIRLTHVVAPSESTQSWAETVSSPASSTKGSTASCDSAVAWASISTGRAKSGNLLDQLLPLDGASLGFHSESKNRSDREIPAASRYAQTARQMGQTAELDERALLSAIMMAHESDKTRCLLCKFFLDLATCFTTHKWPFPPPQQCAVRMAKHAKQLPSTHKMT